ncbi:MAG: GTP-binding protein [Verrucomicrobiota bacterium]|nr:GTP-binding protein [Verrucomicrobiota bacterium]
MNSSSTPTKGELIFEELGSADQSDDQSPSNVAGQLRTIAEKGTLDHLLIECSDHAPLVALASLFLRQESETKDCRGDVTRLASVITIIDSVRFLDQLVTSRGAAAENSPCLTAEQVEFADVIVLDGEPTAPDFVLSEAITSTLNPRARLFRWTELTTTQELLGAGASFDFQGAMEGCGWRELIRSDDSFRKKSHEVATFVYRARRPMHPTKFWGLIHGTFPGVIRAKGFFWLATKMDIAGGLSVAGAECQYGPAGEWGAASHERSGESTVAEHLQQDWEEPFGDRRQAIAFIGLRLDSAALTKLLDACLLTDSEMAAGEDSWSTFADPFPRWAAEKAGHCCHGPECCHHD